MTKQNTAMARRRLGKLEKLGVSLARLEASASSEGVIELPAADAGALPETLWQGEALARVLRSARGWGEGLLVRLERSEILLQKWNPASADESFNQARRNALDAVEEAKSELQNSWAGLIEGVASALQKRAVATQIVPLMDEYYQQTTLLRVGIERLPVWPQVLEGQGRDDRKSRRGRRPASVDVLNTESYPVHTSQEWLALLHTASDGKYGRHFTSDENRGVLRHQRPDAPFWTETVLLDEEKRANLGIEILQRAAGELDLDDCFVWLYISDLIAPIEALAANSYAGGWIDLDEVARKTMGGYAPNPAEAQRRRRKVWHALKYGARAVVGGQRSTPYFDKTTRREIETEIYTTPWQIVARQRPIQPSLFPDDEESVPVRVEVVASREWTALTTSPQTAQFLPMGEMLGAIPPSQPSGAWARALGLAYMHWCRLHVSEALSGQAPPSRRHLLEQFPTKTAPFAQILDSPNPIRAWEYWRGAEGYLREAGMIETQTEYESPLPRKKWKDEWLAQAPAWKPGPRLRSILEALAANRFAPKPRELKQIKSRTRSSARSSVRKTRAKSST